MTEALKYLFEFLFGSRPSPRGRFLGIILVISGVLIIDSRLGFSEHFYESHRIQRISDIQKILDTQKLTVGQRANLILLQDKTIADKRGISQTEHRKRFYSFWYILSFCGFLSFLFFALIIIQMQGKTPLKDTISALSIVLFIVALLALIAWLLAYVKYFTIAYVVNIILQMFAIYGIWYVTTKLDKGKYP